MYAADDGAGGYAYSHGWRGFSEAGYKAGMGDFRVQWWRTDWQNEWKQCARFTLIEQGGAPSALISTRL